MDVGPMRVTVSRDLLSVCANYDADLAASLATVVKAKILAAAPVTLDSLRNRPLVCRLRDGVVRLASPYL